MSLKKSADDENGDKSHAGLGEPAAVSVCLFIDRILPSFILPIHVLLLPRKDRRGGRDLVGWPRGKRKDQLLLRRAPNSVIALSLPRILLSTRKSAATGLRKNGRRESSRNKARQRAEILH